MIDNDNFQKPVSGDRMMGGAVQTQTKHDSIELTHLVTEIVHLAKAALHTVDERFTAERPAIMSNN